MSFRIGVQCLAAVLVTGLFSDCARTQKPPDAARPPAVLDDKSVREMARSAARIRGLPLLHEVQWRDVGAVELERAMHAAELEAAQRRPGLDRRLALTLIAMGLATASPKEQTNQKKAFEDQLYGWYDPLTKMMSIVRRDRPAVVRGDGLDETNLSRAAVIHEAAHALQDQHFGLARLLGTQSEIDSLIAARALVEGDATVVMMDALLTQTLSAPLGGERAVRDGFAEGLPRFERAIEGLSPLGRELSVSVYVDGAAFVAALRRVGGLKLVDRAFREVPVSTSQILHPELYVGGVQPDAIETFESAVLDEAGYRPLTSGRAGELFCRMYLGGDGHDRARGWRGDRFTVFARDGEESSPVLVWISTWESENDAERFANAVWDRAGAPCTGEQRCDAGIPVWSETRGPVAVVVRGLQADVEARVVDEAFAVRWSRPERVPLDGVRWTTEANGERYVDLMTRARLMRGQVKQDRLVMPAVGVEVAMPPGAWSVPPQMPQNFNYAFTAEGGGLVGVMLVPARADAPLGMFTEAVARGASVSSQLRVVATRTFAIGGRTAVAKELRGNANQPAMHIIAVQRSGWVVLLMGVARPTLSAEDARRFKTVIAGVKLVELVDPLAGGGRP